VVPSSWRATTGSRMPAAGSVGDEWPTGSPTLGCFLAVAPAATCRDQSWSPSPTIGIEPRRMRGAALAQLSAEMAPAVLADAASVSPGTAVKWTNLHGGNWASYAAGR